MPFFADNPLSLLVEVMAQGQQRVALFGSDRQLLHTCSQTDVVTAISEMCAKQSAVKGFAPKTLQELGIGHCPVPCVSSKASVQTALEKLFLKEHDVLLSSVAVVDGAEKLAGNFSASDLRSVGAEDLASDIRSTMTIEGYLRKHSPDSLVCRTVKLSDTFASVVAYVVKNHLHKVWVVDSDYKPTHVISLTDLIKAVSSGDKVTPREISGDQDVTHLWISSSAVVSSVKG